MSNKILVLSHRFLTNPGDELKKYLLNKKIDFVYIYHSFSEAENRCSYLEYYKDGKLLKKKKGLDFMGFPEPIIYIKEFFYTFFWLVQFGKFQKAVCLDGLCANYIFIFRSLRRIKKIHFWAIDFVPNQRFSSKLKNWTYHFINKRGYKKSDEMWDLGPRMIEAREKYISFPRDGYKNHQVVPFGCWTKDYPKVAWKNIDKSTLVFMGHMMPKQGVLEVVLAVPQIIKSIPNFKLKLIGGGKFLEKIKKTVKEKKLEKYVDIKGKINSHKELEYEIATSALAIAPYNPKLDIWTYFTDPGKVKVYLACGVPVLLTDRVFHLNKIVENKCGAEIKCESNDIAEKAIDFLSNLEKIKKYRKNALNYAKSFDWEMIFNNTNLIK